MHLSTLYKLWQMFLCHLQKTKKKSAIFDITITVTLGVDMITRQMTPFFNLLSSSICWCISFLHFKTFKFQFYAPSLYFSSGLSKMTLSYLLTYIYCLFDFHGYSFDHFCNFCYITYFVPNLILIWSWSHGLRIHKINYFKLLFVGLISVFLIIWIKYMPIPQFWLVRL